MCHWSKQLIYVGFRVVCFNVPKQLRSIKIKQTNIRKWRGITIYSAVEETRASKCLRVCLLLARYCWLPRSYFIHANMPIWRRAIAAHASQFTPECPTHYWLPVQYKTSMWWLLYYDKPCENVLAINSIITYWFYRWCKFLRSAESLPHFIILLRLYEAFLLSRNCSVVALWANEGHWKGRCFPIMPLRHGMWNRSID